MERIAIPPDWIEESQYRAEKIKKANNDWVTGDTSILKGDGLVYGYLGEIALRENYGMRLMDKFDYDLLCANLKIESKVTWMNKFDPNWESHNCKISKHNPNQLCDYYYFSRVMKDMSAVFLYGSIMKEDFVRLRKSLKGGEYEPGTTWKVKNDCYYVSASDLRPAKKGLLDSQTMT